VADAALDLVPAMNAARGHFAAPSARLGQAVAALGIDTGASTTQILPAMTANAQTAPDLAAALRARDVLAAAIRPPAIPPGTFPPYEAVVA
jgi:8-amino-7-oxononanoate synthase